ncbi:MAG: hypothetical protein NVS2B4_05930 [Ramlibacter sp.]
MKLHHLRLLLPASVLAALAFTLSTALAQAAQESEKATAGVAVAPSPLLEIPPIAAPGASCADKWRYYRISAQCYASFRHRRTVSQEAIQQCGPAVEEPVDCPRQ